MSRKSSPFELVRCEHTHTVPKQAQQAYESMQKKGLQGLMKQLGYTSEQLAIAA
jgi:hypothetical protein